MNKIRVTVNSPGKNKKLITIQPARPISKRSGFCPLLGVGYFIFRTIKIPVIIASKVRNTPSDPNNQCDSEILAIVALAPISKAAAGEGNPSK